MLTTSITSLYVLSMDTKEIQKWIQNRVEDLSFRQTFENPYVDYESIKCVCFVLLIIYYYYLFCLMMLNIYDS